MNPRRLLQSTRRIRFARPLRALGVAASVAFTSLLLAATSLAGPGDLDPTFGDNGKVLTGFGHGEDVGTAVAVQADGKLVMAGFEDASSYSGDLLLVRYDTNNALDPSFGVNGIVRATMPSPNAAVFAVAIQADGKIVVGGVIRNPGTSGDFLVARFLTNGSLDPSFSGDGVAITDFSGDDGCQGLAIQPDGKIVAVGTCNPGSSLLALARYKTNGTLDSTFDGNGVETIGNGSLRGVAIQADGKIVVCGASGSSIIVARVNADGSLDGSFDGDGKALTAIPGSSFSGGHALALQGTAPEKIVVACYAQFGTNFDFALVRYTASGALDATLDGDGIATTAVGSSNDIPYAVVIQSFAITVAGRSSNGSTEDFAVVRYNLSGALDLTFNGTGKRITPVCGDNDEGWSMALQAGKIVVAGYATDIGTNRDFALVRYNSDGTLDTSFDGDGIKTQDIVDLQAQLWDLAVQADGKVVAVGHARWNATLDGSAIARYGTNGALDPSFGSNGRVLFPITGGANAVAVQPDGKIVVVGAYGAAFSTLRLNADGSTDGTFGGGDLVDTAIGTSATAYAVALQTDGKILVAGTATIGSQTDVALVRYNVDGTLDTSFDGDGIVTTAVASGNDEAREVRIQADGKIVVAGWGVVSGTNQFALVRYNANGSLDNTFGSFGRVVTDIGTGQDVGAGMLIQPDGKIVVCGASESSSFDVAVARYNSNGSLDLSFDGDGKVTTPIGFESDAGYAIARQADGKLVVAGVGVIGSNAQLAVLRYDGSGALDPSYGVGGKAVPDVGPGYANAVALDASGRAIVGGVLGERFGLVRLLDAGTVAVTLEPIRIPVGRIELAAPNPATGPQTFVVDMAPGSERVSLSVYDVAGQRVWTRDLTGQPAGTHRFVWNGRTPEGDTVPPGVYFARLDGQPISPAYRVVRVR